MFKTIEQAFNSMFQQFNGYTGGGDYHSVGMSLSEAMCLYWKAREIQIWVDFPGATWSQIGFQSVQVERPGFSGTDWQLASRPYPLSEIHDTYDLKQIKWDYNGELLSPDFLTTRPFGWSNRLQIQLPAFFQIKGDQKYYPIPGVFSGTTGNSIWLNWDFWPGPRSRQITLPIGPHEYTIWASIGYNCPFSQTFGYYDFSTAGNNNVWSGTAEKANYAMAWVYPGALLSELPDCDDKTRLYTALGTGYYFQDAQAGWINPGFDGMIYAVGDERNHPLELRGVPRSFVTVLSQDAPDCDVSMSVKKYWTYRGLYNEDTGELAV